MIAEVFVLHLLQFTGPDQQHIQINPVEVVSTREPRGKDHVATGVHCLIFTVDGKFTAVIEDCKTVSDLLEQAK